MPTPDNKGLGGDVGSLKPANIASDSASFGGSLAVTGSMAVTGDVVATGLVSQGGVAIRGGSGVSSNAVGINGDIYINIAGGVLTTIYQRRAGAYVGIV